MDIEEKPIRFCLITDEDIQGLSLLRIEQPLDFVSCGEMQKYLKERYDLKALGITAKDYWMKEEPVQGLICNGCFKELYPEAWTNSPIGEKHMEEERLYRKGYSDGLLGKPYHFKTSLK